MNKEIIDKYVNNDHLALEGGSEKPIAPEGLEEAAEEYAGVNYDCETETDAFYHHIQTEAFIAGAEWDRAKMMEGAVDCIVENWNEEPHPEITIPLNPEEFTAGDKVRVIVIKEDQK